MPFAAGELDVDGRTAQLDGTIDISSASPVPGGSDVDNRHSQQRQPVTHGSLAGLSQQLEANFPVRASPMDERNTPGGSSTEQGPVVTGLLCDLQCFCGVAEGGLIRQQRPVRNRETVGVTSSQPGGLRGRMHGPTRWRRVSRPSSPQFPDTVGRRPASLVRKPKGIR